MMKLPGEAGEEFVGILPFTPANRNNLIGWIAGRSDGANYGTSIVYDFPKTRLVDGPLQIEARIDQNAQLSGPTHAMEPAGIARPARQPDRYPCGGAHFCMREPIYLQAERSPMPELRLVVLALQDKLAYGPTFETALASLYGGTASSLSAAETPRPTTESVNTPGAPQPAQDMNSLIAEAGRDFADYQRLTSEGKLGEAGKKLDELKRALDKLRAQSK